MVRTMFTGLVQHIGTVARIGMTPAGNMRLGIDPGSWDHEPSRGDSIAVRGVCLTVANQPRRGRWVMEFDAVPETLAKTTLGAMSVGDRVNLEHAATMATLLGGHMVQGHVDGAGRVVDVVKPKAGATAAGKGTEWLTAGYRIAIAIPEGAGLASAVVEKGSICVDGVSLTIAEVWSRRIDGKRRDGLTVALIPETLERTTLGDLQAGDGVNLEMDIFAKTIVRYLERIGTNGKRGTVKARRR